MNTICPFCEYPHSVEVATADVDGRACASFKCNKCQVRWLSFDPVAVGRFMAWLRENPSPTPSPAYHETLVPTR
ncbi:MAG: hypothetical protein JWQ89_3325 [Devosia sp.]|nr:hypothetical protein [Devosia sp.]